MKTAMIALALFLGLAPGATLVTGGQAHAAGTSWTPSYNGGGSN